MVDSTLAEKAYKRAKSLKTSRIVWDDHYQDLADYMLPRKNSITQKKTSGDKRNEVIYDGTALQAVDLLGASLHGMLTSPSVPWFELSAGNPSLDSNYEIKQWLEETTNVMRNAFSLSNFNMEVHEAYIDLVVFGTAAMYSEFVDGKLRFSTRHISEFFITEDNHGRVDSLYRWHKDSARVLVQKFGLDEVGERIAKIYSKEPDQEIQIIHAVFPRDEYDATKIDKLNKPYESLYLDGENGKLISQGGFDEFPYVVPRFLKSTGEHYGRSVAMNALPDVRMLNLMSKTIIMASQKQIDPPLLVPDDGFALPIRTAPSSINFYRAGGRDTITPLNTQANIPLGLNMEDQRRSAIRSAFFVDQILSGRAPNMTATEVLQRNEERMRVLGPVLGRLTDELLRPLIDRTYALLDRAGLISEPPESLQGADINIEYVSPMARAAKSSGLNSTMQAIQMLMPLSESMPIMDYINGDGIVKHVVQSLGVPTQVIRSDAEVKALRKQRAEKEAEMAEQEQTQKDIYTAAQAGQAMTNISSATKE